MRKKEIEREIDKLENICSICNPTNECWDCDTNTDLTELENELLEYNKNNKKK
ncbi:MAG: hypothetical protein ACRDCW_06715 [Sarcina sp.]